MKLNEIIGSYIFTVIKGDLQKEIEHIAYNSKKVGNNSLFVCIKGFKVDGHDFIDQAISNGANSLLVECDIESIPKNIPESITVIKVSDARNALAYVAANFYDHCYKNFNLIGVTGTKGKSSVAYLIKQILDYTGVNTGIIGTGGAVINKKILDSESAAKTTPESLELHQIFYEMNKAGAKCVVMEVSSHALDLCRIDYCQFDTGIFTNLSSEHLDFHGTMELYEKAKLKLFKRCNTSIINKDDLLSQRIISENNNIITYSAKQYADIYASNITQDDNKISFRINYDKNCITPDIVLPERIHIYNVLAAFAVCHKMKVDVKSIIGGLGI